MLPNFAKNMEAWGQESPTIKPNMLFSVLSILRSHSMVLFTQKYQIPKKY